jgi:hypothetical protein
MEAPPARDLDADPGPGDGVPRGVDHPAREAVGSVELDLDRPVEVAGVVQPHLRRLPRVGGMADAQDDVVLSVGRQAAHRELAAVRRHRLLLRIGLEPEPASDRHGGAGDRRTIAAVGHPAADGDPFLERDLEPFPSGLHPVDRRGREVARRDPHREDAGRQGLEREGPVPSGAGAQEDGRAGKPPSPAGEPAARPVLDPHPGAGERLPVRGDHSSADSERPLDDQVAEIDRYVLEPDVDAQRREPLVNHLELEGARHEPHERETSGGIAPRRASRLVLRVEARGRWDARLFDHLADDAGPRLVGQVGREEDLGTLERLLLVGDDPPAEGETTTEDDLHRGAPGVDVVEASRGEALLLDHEVVRRRFQGIKREGAARVARRPAGVQDEPALAQGSDQAFLPFLGVEAAIARGARRDGRAGHGTAILITDPAGDPQGRQELEVAARRSGTLHDRLAVRAREVLGMAGEQAVLARREVGETVLARVIRLGVRQGRRDGPALPGDGAHLVRQVALASQGAARAFRELGESAQVDGKDAGPFHGLALRARDPPEERGRLRGRRGCLPGRRRRQGFLAAGRLRGRAAPWCGGGLGRRGPGARRIALPPRERARREEDSTPQDGGAQDQRHRVFLAGHLHSSQDQLHEVVDPPAAGEPGAGPRGRAGPRSPGARDRAREEDRQLAAAAPPLALGGDGLPDRRLETAPEPAAEEAPAALEPLQDGCLGRPQGLRHRAHRLPVVVVKEDRFPH